MPSSFYPYFEFDGTSEEAAQESKGDLAIDVGLSAARQEHYKDGGGIDQ